MCEVKSREDFPQCRPGLSCVRSTSLYEYVQHEWDSTSLLMFALREARRGRECNMAKFHTLRTQMRASLGRIESA